MSKDNILAREPINKLIAKFAIPAILSTLVGALYNMVDQVFVGRGVGHFLSFQIFPRQIISFFGQGDELYYEFGVKFFRIYMFLTLLNGLLPLIGNYFASIGKPVKGIFMISTRQFLFLVPLLIILPKFWGINE